MILDFLFNEYFSTMVSPTYTENVYAKDGKVFIELVLPGVLKSDVKVDLIERSSALHVSWKYKEKTYYRKFSVKKINPNSIKARLENGILTVSYEIVSELSEGAISIPLED